MALLIVASGTNAFGQTDPSTTLAVTSGENAATTAASGTAVTLTAFGDSITVGYQASTPAKAYINLVGAAEDWAVNNLAHSGDTLFDQAKVIYGTTPTASSLSSLLIGQNDGCGGTPRNAEWASNHEAVAAYLLTPNKWTGQDSRVVRTGTWTDSTQTPFGIQTSVDGSSASVVTTGSAFYLAYTATYGSTAVITVTNAETGHTLAIFTPSAESSIIPHVPQLLRIPFGSATQRAIVITVTSTGGGTFYLDWMADNADQGRATAWFLTPFATKNMTALYQRLCEAAVGNTVDQLSADGLNAFKVDLLPVCFDANLNPACNQSGDGTHPNDAGMAIIANEFIRRINEVTASNENFGTRAVGSTRSAPLTVAFGSAATLGSISISTQGAPNLDFKPSPAGTTCKVKSVYGAGSACTISVAFTPRVPGTRIGAAVLNDESGNRLATAYLQGNGQAPRVTFSPGKQTVAVGGLGRPTGLALDGGGNLYIADSGTGKVYKEAPSGATYFQSTVASGIDPNEIAVDGVGTLYVSDSSDGVVWLEAPSGNRYTQTTQQRGLYQLDLSNPEGVAVDGSGNVYIANTDDNRVLKEALWEDMYSESTVRSGLTGTGGTGLASPRNVAVDGSGNVYTADARNNRILKQTLSQSGYIPGYIQSTLAGGLSSPTGVAVDGIGNVYIADTGNDRVLMETRWEGGYIRTTLASGLNGPEAVAVDASGDVFIADTGNGRVLKVDLSDSPSVGFASTDVGATSASQQIAVTNNGNATLSITSIAVTGADASSFGFAGNCGSSLAAGASCTLHGHFAPAKAGALTAAVTIKDNSSGSPHTIALSGTGVGVPKVTLSASSLSFGGEKVGEATDSKNVTLTNTGSATLYLTGISVTGVDASSFDFANTCGTSLAVKASCYIHGHFAPKKTGAVTAEATIEDNGDGSPQSIAVSGTGQ